MRFATRAIHAAQPSDSATGALIAPIYQTSTFEQEAPGSHLGFDYARTANPTRQRLEHVLADLEGVSHCAVFGSGLAAEHAVLQAYLRTGDRAPKDAAYEFGETTSLIELPVAWGLDDFPVSEYVPGQLEGLRAPSAIEEMWRGDFDYALAHSERGIFNLTLHPQVIGRGNRMLMLDRLLDYFRKRGARFDTLVGYATRWKATNPLEEWKTTHADLTGIHALKD